MKIVLKRRAASSRTTAMGVKKITRDGYSTVNGFSKNNSWWELNAQVRKRDKGMCVPCARAGKQVVGVEVHHIRSLRDGGRNVMSNLMLVCAKCHDRRHNHLHRARS